MKVELKKFKPHQDLSEETLCFSAHIWIDGKPAGHVRNRGHGGSHDYDFTDPETRRTFETHARKITGEAFDPMDDLIDRLIQGLEEVSIVKANIRKGFLVTVLIQKGPYDINGKTFYKDEYYVGIPHVKHVEALAKKHRADQYRVVS